MTGTMHVFDQEGTHNAIPLRGFKGRWGWKVHYF